MRNVKHCTIESACIYLTRKKRKRRKGRERERKKHGTTQSYAVVGWRQTSFSKQQHKAEQVFHFVSECDSLGKFICCFTLGLVLLLRSICFGCFPLFFTILSWCTVFFSVFHLLLLLLSPSCLLVRALSRYGKKKKSHCINYTGEHRVCVRMQCDNFYVVAQRHFTSRNSHSRSNSRRNNIDADDDVGIYRIQS